MGPVIHTAATQQPCYVSNQSSTRFEKNSEKKQFEKNRAGRRVFPGSPGFPQCESTLGTRSLFIAFHPGTKDTR